jgi:hypothetical protein
VALQSSVAVFQSLPLDASGNVRFPGGKAAWSVADMRDDYADDFTTILPTELAQPPNLRFAPLMDMDFAVSCPLSGPARNHRSPWSGSGRGLQHGARSQPPRRLSTRQAGVLSGRFCEILPLVGMDRCRSSPAIRVADTKQRRANSTRAFCPSLFMRVLPRPHRLVLYVSFPGRIYQQTGDTHRFYRLVGRRTLILRFAADARQIVSEHSAKSSARLIMGRRPGCVIEQHQAARLGVLTETRLVISDLKHARIAHDLHAGIPLRQIFLRRREKPCCLKGGDRSVLKFQNTPIHIGILTTDSIAAETVVVALQRREFPKEPGQWDGRVGQFTLGRMDELLGGSGDESVTVPRDELAISHCRMRVPANVGWPSS